MNFECRVWTLDGDGSDNRMGMRINPLRIEMFNDTVIPGIPQGQIYQIPDIEIPASVSQDDRPKYAKAIQLARWVQRNLNGAIGNKSALRYLRDQIMLPFLVGSLETASGRLCHPPRPAPGLMVTDLFGDFSSTRASARPRSALRLLWQATLKVKFQIFVLSGNPEHALLGYCQSYSTSSQAQVS